MRLIVCLDMNGGMAFNKRRQTRDAVQRRHMNEALRGEVLLMSTYSEKLYREELGEVSIVADEELFRAVISGSEESIKECPQEGSEECPQEGSEESCRKERPWEHVEKPANIFVEREAVEVLLDKAEEIWVYQWNRSYPSDVRFPVARLSAYEKVREESFAGSSHDNISFEVYRR